jgi:N-acetylmuramic acid 6-phosphate etherase
MNFDKITESDSKYDKLESKSVEQLLTTINKEDQTVALCVKKEIHKINKLITKVVSLLKNEGRLFLYWFRHKWKIRCSRCF